MKPFEEIFDVSTMVTALTAHIEHNYFTIVGAIYERGAVGLPISNSLARSEGEQLALLENRSEIFRRAESMVRENYARKAARDALWHGVQKGKKLTKAQRVARQRARSEEAERAKRQKKAA